MPISKSLKHLGGLLLHGGLNCLLVHSGAGILGLPSIVSELGKAITGNLASEHFGSLTSVEALKKRLVDPDASKVNHDLERLFRQSIVISLQFIKTLFLAEIREDLDVEMNLSEKERARLLSSLEKFFRENIDILSDDMKSQEKQPLDKSIIREPGTFIDEIIRYIFGISSVQLDAETMLRLRRFYSEKLPYCFQLAFKEALKNDEQGFKAFQLWVIEDMRSGQQSLQTGQQKILEAISNISKGQQLVSDFALQNILEKQTRLIYERLQTGFSEPMGYHFDQVSRQIEDGFESLYRLNTEHYDLSREMLEILKDVLEKMKSPATTIDAVLTPPPFDTSIFIGREADLATMKQQLTKSDHMVLLLNGEGGVGKTTLASQYWIENRPLYHHLIWLFVESGILNGLLSLSVALKINFQEKSLPGENAGVSLEQQLDAVIQKLANLPKPSLLVIDNANSKDDLSRYHKVLKRLLNFHIIVTTRVKLPDTALMKVTPLKEDRALELFERFYNDNRQEEESEAFSQADRALLQEILRAINHNTLVIELLSKNLREKNAFKTQYSLQNMLSDLQQKGLLLLSTTKVETQYQNFTAARPEEIIRAMYDMHSLTAYENSILGVFAILPAERIGYAVLLDLFKPDDTENFDETLAQLSSKGWIDFNTREKNFKISQVIQQVILDANKTIARHEYTWLMRNLSPKLLNADDNYNLYARMSESVLKIATIDDYPSAYLGYLLAYFYYEKDQLAVSEKLILELLSIIDEKNAEDTNFRYLKQYVHWLYALVLEALDRYSEAGQFFHEARNLASGLKLSFDEIRYAIYLTKIGRFAESEPILYEDYMRLKNLQKGDVHSPHSSELALRAHDFSGVLRVQERYDEAIFFQKEAMTIYAALYGSDHEYLAITRMSLARILIAQKADLELAEELMRKAYAVYKNIYSEDQINMGYYYLVAGSYYLAREDIKTAVEYIEKGTQVLSKPFGAQSKRVLEATIEQCLLAWKLFQNGQIDVSYCEEITRVLVPALYDDFNLFMNRFGTLNPLFQQAIKLVAEIFASRGDTERASFLQLKLKEFTRLSNNRAVIRTDHLHLQEIPPDDRDRLVSLFQTVHSLPLNQEHLQLEKYALPFYPTYCLFRLRLQNTPQTVDRYLLSNGKECIAVNYKNSPIYKVSELEGSFNALNIFHYIDFFFDAVCERLGFFFLVRNDRLIPWKLDEEITDEKRETIRQIISDRKVLADDEEEIIAESFIVFKNGLFVSKFRVKKRDGVCELFNSGLCCTRSNGEIVFLDVDEWMRNGSMNYFDQNKNPVSISTEESDELNDTIPACKDPIYYMPLTTAVS